MSNRLQCSTCVCVCDAYSCLYICVFVCVVVVVVVVCMFRKYSFVPPVTDNMICWTNICVVCCFLAIFGLTGE